MNSAFKKILIFIFVSWTFFTIGPIFAQEKKPEIILENGIYYCLQPNGEKVMIVRELEYGGNNKAKLSPDGKYVVYTTTNGLGFEGEGRDLFSCKTDGSERTFLHKFVYGINYWIWVSKGTKKFIIVAGGQGGETSGIYVLDSQKGTILLNFPVDSVELTEGKGCVKIKGYRFEKELCADELFYITQEHPFNCQVFWNDYDIYLTTEREPIVNYQKCEKLISPIYKSLSPEEKTLYKGICDSFSVRYGLFAEANFSADKKSVNFRMSGIWGKYDLKSRKIVSFDFNGELSLKVYYSPKGKYLAILKTEQPESKKIEFFENLGEAIFKPIFTKEFDKDIIISNIVWSQEDEEKMYYSLDSLMIDLKKRESGK
jgi:hypothetical protein